MLCKQRSEIVDHPPLKEENKSDMPVSNVKALRAGTRRRVPV
jgi:hypothetical protein